MDFSLQLGYNYDLFHFFNELISHGVFLFFTIWYIRFITYATKIVTLQLHYVLSTCLPNNNKCTYTYLPPKEKLSSTTDFYVSDCKQHWQLKNHPTSNSKSPMTSNCKKWMIFCVCKICIKKLYIDI
jgi:hypothetical protein